MDALTRRNFQTIGCRREIVGMNNFPRKRQSLISGRKVIINNPIINLNPQTTMKNFLLFAAVALMATACTSENDQLLNESTVMNQAETETVTLTFSPYDMEAMARAGSVPAGSTGGTRATRAAVADFANKLDIWLFADGEQLQAVQQESSEAGFATLTLTLDKRKTYTLYAVAHKSSAGHATLADGIITWTNDKISQSFYCTRTFTPADVTTIDCQMDRIVGQFRLETTDVLPDEAVAATITVPQTFTAWSTATNQATTPKERTVSFSNITAAADGTTSLSAYLISTATAPTGHTVTVTFLTADGQPVQQRTFENVPIRNGYRTTYRGNFFTDAAFTSTFTVADWQEFDTVEF